MRTPTALILTALTLSVGCGPAVPIILAHDKVLGPVSPAGEVRGAATGDDFEVTPQGVVAKPSDQLFRPDPRNALARVLKPSSFYAAVLGIEAVLAGISPFVLRTEKIGDPLKPEQLGRIQVGMTSAQVFDVLGSPQQWIKRREGSLMAYRADRPRSLAFDLGAPPPIDVAHPTGSHPSFRYTTQFRRPFKTILFFDRDEHLTSVSSNVPSAKVSK